MPVSLAALAYKSPDLPKAVSQSPRIQLTLNSDTDCRLQIRKHSIGGPGALWHLKNSDLSNAVSQSPEFSGAEFGKKKPVSKAEKHSKARTGKLSQKAQLFAVLAQGVCTRHEYFNAKTPFPWSLTTFEKVGFPLLYQSSKSGKPNFYLPNKTEASILKNNSLNIFSVKINQYTGATDVHRQKKRKSTVKRTI